MSQQKIFFHNPFKLLFSFLLIWAVLFEFVLVANGILPKPSSAFYAVKDIINIYHFLPNLFFSVGAITFGLLFSVVLVFIFKKLLLNKTLFSDIIFAVNKLKHFIPVIILSSFLILWFTDSIYTEYIFIFLIGFVYLSSEIIIKIDKKDQVYLLAAKSLKLPGRIRNEIKFKQLLPMLDDSFLNLHFILWGVMLTFEFVQNQWGFGTIIFNSLKFRDMPTLFVVSLVIYILISAGYYIIKFLFNRFVYWE